MWATCDLIGQGTSKSGDWSQQRCHDRPMPTSPETPRFGWVAVERDGAEHWFTRDSSTPLPSPPPKPTKPLTIRMFVDDVSGVGLWLDIGWDYPDSPYEYLFYDEPENLLPISSQLRDDIRSWVDEYTATFDGREARFGWVEHDRRGLHLSERLRSELPSDEFEVQYRPHTREVREEQNGGRTTVQLMCDHGADWPLWDEGGTGPEDWPKLSEPLRQALLAWSKYWYDNYDHRRGWTDGTQAAFARDGHRLKKELQRQLGGEFKVELVL